MDIRMYKTLRRSYQNLNNSKKKKQQIKIQETPHLHPYHPNPEPSVWELHSESQSRISLKDIPLTSVMQKMGVIHRMKKGKIQIMDTPNIHGDLKVK